jgi:ATP-dependent helicase HrpA
MSSTPELERWYRTLDGERRRALEWTLAEVLVGDASRDAEFPRFLRVGTHALDLEYHFEPGHPADGVTLVVPLALLNAVPTARLDWLVPGMLAEKAAELIRSLPKALRRHFVPAPDFARAFVEAAEIADVPLLPTLAAHLERIGGLAVPVESFDAAGLPAHLRFNIRLLDADGSVLAEGRDLAALRDRHGARAREQFARETSTAIAREGLVRFDVDEVPREIRTDTGLAAFPALVDTGDSAAIRVFEMADDAQRAHGDGVLRLVRLALADKARSARKQLPLGARVAIAYTPIGSPDALRGDIVDAAVVDLVRDAVGAVRTRAAFDSLVADAGRRLFAAAMERLALVEAALTEYASLLPRLQPPLMGFARANYDEMRAQLRGLVHAGFAHELARERLADLPRYLKAMALRVGRLEADPRKDQQRMLEVATFADEHDALRDALAAGPPSPAHAPLAAGVERLRWAIEELRVQLFAQELKTREAVSEKRLRKMVDELRKDFEKQGLGTRG